VRYAFGTSVGERGQITIERAIRERLGIRPKDIAVQRVEDGRLVVEFIRPHEPHMRSLAGVLAPSPKGPREPLDIEDAVGRGIAEEWHAYLTRAEAERQPSVAAPRRRRRAP
jgi:bifunctional DNA-binding transcriptional regulator/antitoxin component of YhaV-PrlF toxin-antitoxin module